MGQPYGHQLLNAATSSTGEMNCSTCKKPITDGEYLSYQKTANWDWHYVTHHRICSMSNPKWAAMWDKRDRQVAAHLARNEALLAAAVEFRDKWKVGDLDDLIERLTPAPVFDDVEDEDEDDLEEAF